MDESLPTNYELQQHENKEMAVLSDIQQYIKGENKMDTPTIENVFKTGGAMPGYDNLGFGGGGMLGMVALLALLGRNNGGFLGNDGNGGSAVNQLTLNQLQSTLGDIKASIPYAESQAQLALAGAQADINSNISNHSTALMQGISASQLQTANLASQLGDKVDAGFSANALATANAQFNLSQAISADGEKTRALIQSIDKTNDSRLITSQANEITELRAANARDAANHALTITMNNNQNQNQIQFQQQQQAIATVANGLFDALQSIRATNQAINIGSGLMQANPTNTNTNVRA